MSDIASVLKPGGLGPVTNPAGRFQPGQSGNVHGRPVGARNRISEQMISDIAASWEKHGPASLEKMARTDTSRYVEVCSRLIPRDVSVILSTRLPGNLEPTDWEAMLGLLGAIKTALPDDRRSPSEVAQFVSDAIRLHSAKLVEQ